MNILLSRRIKNILIIASFLAFFFVGGAPLSADAQTCMDICTAPNAFGSTNCLGNKCNGKFPAGGGPAGDGRWCSYILGNATENLCVEQTAASRACQEVDTSFRTTREACEEAGGGPGGICEFTPGVFNRCLAKGSIASAEAEIVDFWSANTGRAPTTQLNYTLLDDSLFGAGPAPATLCSYTDKMFTTGIGIAGILAVIMIVVGGFQFIVGASNPATRSAAKDRITYAVIGLLLALSSWVVLNTINDDLISGCFVPTPTNVIIPIAPTLTDPPPTVNLTLNDSKVCLVMDPASTNSVRNYVPYNMRAGVTATVDGTDVACQVKMSFTADIPVNQKGATTVTYTLTGAPSKTRAVSVDSAIGCAFKFGYTTWDSGGVPTIPPNAGC